MAGFFPKLRSDLNLYKAARHVSGAPSWTLHDPASNRFFRLGWMEFEFLKRWGAGKLEAVLSSIKQETTLSPNQEDFKNFAEFLSQNQLLDASGEATTKQLMQQVEAKKIKPVSWAIKNYLFVRIPLVKPDRFLSWLLPIISPIFKNLTLKILFMCAALGAFLIIQDWEEFLRGFRVLQTPGGLITAFFVLAFAKVIHELGHALASKYYGCRVPAMGVALIVLWPLLWTDTTEGWKLKDKNKRLMIDGAGMIAELGVAALASILWAISPDGDFKVAMHLLATTSWVMTLAVNANPFMRFDGYYLLSDATDIPNLQNRSFALAKWWLRKKLFALDVPPPEKFLKQTQRWLILYAIGTWIYRFFLFLGISLLVYHFFFKALGVALMIVELWWFIGKPIVNELKAWKAGMMNIKGTRRLRFYQIVTFGLLLILAVPLPHNIYSPALMKSAQESPLIAPQASQLFEIHIQNGQSVKAGDILFTLNAPELEKQQTTNALSIKYLQKQLAQSSVSSQNFSQANLQRNDLLRVKSESIRLQSEKDSLIIKSPFDGVVRDLSEVINTGDWLEKREFLGLLVSKNYVIETYVSEYEIEKIKPGSKLEFIASDTLEKVSGIVSYIEQSSVKTLKNEELASIHGGTIPVKADRDNFLRPEYRIYKIVAEIEQANNPERRILGDVKIQAGWNSIAWSASKKIYSLIIRESGL